MPKYKFRRQSEPKVATADSTPITLRRNVTFNVESRAIYSAI